MKKKIFIKQFEGEELNIINEYVKLNPLDQYAMKALSQWKASKIKIESAEWIKNRIEKILSFKNSTCLEVQILRYGEELGTRKYNDSIERNRINNSGSNNAMAGISVEQRMKNKYGKDWEQYYSKWRKNQKHFGSDNVAYGKTNKEFLMNAWINSGLSQSEAEQKWQEKCKKHSQSGEKNGMYGKVPSNKAGLGWSGRYKYKHYFRSLRELAFILFLEENNIPFISAEGKIKIHYYDTKKTARTYTPDFIINNNELIEIKPEKMKNIAINLLKFEAAKKWAELNSYTFNVLDFNIPEDDIIFNLYTSKLIIFSNKVEQKAVNYFTKRGLIT